MEVYKLYYDGILEIGKCELADETVFERSGYFYTSCRANVGKSLTAFLEAVHCCGNSLSCVFHAVFCMSKGFHCLKETGGRDRRKLRPGKDTSVETSVAASSTN